MMKIFFILFLAISFEAMAQTPPALIKYDGNAPSRRVKSGQNILNNMAVDIRIHSGTPTGKVVYSERHKSVPTDEDGNFTVNIGSGVVKSGTNLSNIDWSARSYFLETAYISGKTSENLGTVQMLTVPYAFHAGTVENADDADADPSNELIQSLRLNGENLEITEAGQLHSVNLSALSNGDAGNAGNGNNEVRRLDDLSDVFSSGESLFLGDGRAREIFNGNAANISIGNNSLRGMQNAARHNVAIGANTLHNVNGGISNTAIGHNALFNTTTSFNTAIGAEAMSSNFQGNNNVCIGSYTMHNMVNSSGNTCIGNGAGSSNRNTNRSNCVFIGKDAGKHDANRIDPNQNSSDRLYISNTPGKPLIGGSFSSQEIDLNGSVNIKTVLNLKPLNLPPNNPQKGDMYMNEGTSHIEVYDGNLWRTIQWQ